MAAVPKDLREQVLERDGHQCRYCGSRRKPLQADHVYPESAGGQTIIENLATACYSCNMEKGRSVGVWPKPLGYFSNPLRRLLVFCDKMFPVLRREHYQIPPAVNGPDMSKFKVSVIGKTESKNLFIDLPISESRMIALAGLLINGVPFTYGLAGPGKLMSRSEYENLRNRLLAYGFLEWRRKHDQKSGLKLSGNGWQFFQQYVEKKGGAATNLSQTG